MTLKAFIQQRAQKALGIVQASYEAVRWSPNRAALPGTVQDVGADLTPSVLMTLRKKSRYLYRNSPIVRGLVERLVTYIVGTGIHPSAASSVDEWNSQATQAFDDWATHADVMSRATLATLEQVIIRSVIIDGEIFVVLTYGPSGRPRIQLLEAHRIEDVICDSIGRPVRYTFALPTDAKPGDKAPAPLEAESVIHIFKPERAGQRRGVPLLASAINTVQDVDEIVGMERAAVKEHGSKTNIVKTKTGEVRGPVVGASARTLTAQPNSDKQYYREVIGPETIVLSKDEEFEQLVSQRPSQTWQGFIDFLTQTVCLAANLPPSVFLQIKVGGADTRRDLAAAQRVVEQWQQLLSDSLQRVWEYVIEFESTDGPIGEQPADWRRVVWHYPPKVTVDDGRTSNADRDNVRSGMMTFAEYFGQYGEDYREQLRQRIREQKLILDIAEEEGVDPALVLNFLGQTPGAAPMTPTEQNNQEQ